MLKLEGKMMNDSSTDVREMKGIEQYPRSVLKLIEDNKVIENNGMFYSHDENDTEYSLYITYESRERVYIKVGSKALDKWPVDNGEFIAYAMSIINTEDNEQ